MASMISSAVVSTQKGESDSQAYSHSFLFPLYAEITRRVWVPPIFDWIIVLYNYFTYLLSSFLLFSTTIHPSISKNLGIIFRIVDLGISRAPWAQAQAIGAVCLAVHLFVIIWFFTLYLRYQKERKFLKFDLYLTYFFGSALIYPMMLSSSTSVGRSVIQMASFSDDATGYVFFIFSAIALYADWRFFSLASALMFKSTILSPSLFGAHDNIIHRVSYSTIILAAFFSQFATIFDEWFNMLPAVLVFGLSCYVLYIMRVMVYYRLRFQVIISGLIPVTILLPLVAIVKLYVPQTLDYVIVLIGIGSSFLFCIGARFYYFRKSKRVQGFLTRHEEITKNVDLIEHFKSEGPRDTGEALTYLRIGLEMRLDYFVDFSFVNYLIDEYGDYIDVVCAIAQVSTLFPAEVSTLQRVMAMIGNTERLEIHQEYLLSQLHNVFVIRQACLTVEHKNELEELKAKANRTIHSVRMLWVDITESQQEVSLGALNAVMKQVHLVNNNYKDTIENNPNSMLLMEHYMNFLIEAQGDFQDAVKIYHRKVQLEEGKKLAVDHSFRSLCRAFPDYLLKNVLDKNGNLKSRRENDPNYLASIDSTSHYQPTNTLLEKNYGSANDIIENANLRVQLERLMKQSHFKQITRDAAFVLLQFLICIFILIIISVLVPLRATPLVYHTKMSKMAFDISASVKLIGLAASTFYAYSLPVYTFDEVKAAVGPTTWEVPSILVKQNEAISFWSNSLRELYTKYSIYLTSNPKDIKLFVKPNEHDDISLDTTAETTLLGSLSRFLEQTNSFASHPGDTNLMKDIALNSIEISEMFMISQEETFNIGYKRGWTSSNNLKYGAYIIAGIFLVIVAFLDFFFLPTFYRFVTMLTRVLNHVSPEAVEESLKPIRKGGDALKKDHTAAVNGKNGPIYLLIVIQVFLTIGFGCVLFAVAIITSSKIHVFQDVATAIKSTRLPLPELLDFCHAILVYATSLVPSSEIVPLIPELGELFIKDHKNSNLKLMDVTSTSLPIALDSKCDGNIETFLKMVKCSSVEELANTCETYVNRLLSDGVSATTVNSESFSWLMYIVGYPFFNMSLTQADMVIHDAEAFVHEMGTVMQIITGCTFAVSLVLIFAIFFILFHISRSYDNIKHLLLLLPPERVIENKVVMGILGKESSNAEYSLSCPDLVLSGCSQSLIILSKDLIIDSCNHSCSKVFEYGKEELLGRHLDSVLPNSLNDEFYCKIQELKNETIDEFHCEISIKKDEYTFETMSCRCFSYFDSLGLSKIIVWVIDMNETNKLKKEMSKIQDRLSLASSSLVSKLGHDFHFDQSLVILINLCGIQFLSSSMSPSEIMNLLNSAYDAIDRCLKSFPTLARIKMRETEIIVVGAEGETTCEESLKFAAQLKEMGEVQQHIEFQLAITKGELCGRVKDTEIEIVGPCLDKGRTISRLMTGPFIVVDEIVREEMRTSEYTFLRMKDPSVSMFKVQLKK